MPPGQFLRELLLVCTVALVLAVVSVHNGPEIFVHKILGLL